MTAHTIKALPYPFAILQCDAWARVAYHKHRSVVLAVCNDIDTRTRAGISDGVVDQIVEQDTKTILVASNPHYIRTLINICSTTARLHKELPDGDAFSFELPWNPVLTERGAGMAGLVRWREGARDHSFHDPKYSLRP